MAVVVGAGVVVGGVVVVVVVVVVVGVVAGVVVVVVWLLLLSCGCWGCCCRGGFWIGRPGVRALLRLAARHGRALLSRPAVVFVVEFFAVGKWRLPR